MPTDTKTPWTPYVSIDLETTGLNENYAQILEIGAVIDDWKSPLAELPRFQTYIQPLDQYGKEQFVYGSPFALALNAGILRKLVSGDANLTITRDVDVGPIFARWLTEHGIDPLHVNPAGKNFASFDLQFFKQIDGFDKHVNFRHRTIDPAMYYWLPDVDSGLPDTKNCLKRAGLDDTVAHTAVEDCLSVIQLVRRGVLRCIHQKAFEGLSVVTELPEGLKIET
jgi:hypothetical protein